MRGPRLVAVQDGPSQEPSGTMARPVVSVMTESRNANGRGTMSGCTVLELQLPNTSTQTIAMVVSLVSGQSECTAPSPLRRAWEVHIYRIEQLIVVSYHERTSPILKRIRSTCGYGVPYSPKLITLPLHQLEFLNIINSSIDPHF